MYFNMILTAQFFLSLSIHTRRSQKYIGIVKGFLRRVVRYVLSAKDHELGYSILINNYVILTNLKMLIPC